MKIKEVCELTGLTDRAIRFYIESGLIDPQKSENYMGRRSFAFNESDIKRLNTIATLRKSGFSIDEIQNLLTSNDILSIIEQRIILLSAENEENKNILLTLEKARSEKDISLKRLEEILNTPIIKGEIPRPDSEPPFPKLLKKAKKLIITLSVICFISVLSATVFLATIFTISGGYSEIEHRFNVGTAILTVYKNGNLLTCDSYQLSTELTSTECQNGHCLDIDYGKVSATLILDNKTINIGFINDNNWHHVFMTVNLIEHSDGVKVEQIITYVTDNGIINVKSINKEMKTDETEISVFIEGI